MIIEKPNEQYAHCRIPGLVITDRGTLVGCYECRRYSSDWADIDLNKATDWRFCTDEDVPEEGMIRFFYGERDWELLFLGDVSLKEILGESRIRLVAFRKTAKIRDY